MADTAAERAAEAVHCTADADDDHTYGADGTRVDLRVAAARGNATGGVSNGEAADRETDLLGEARRHEGTIRRVAADEEVAPAHQTYTLDGTGSWGGEAVVAVVVASMGYRLQMGIDTEGARHSKRVQTNQPYSLRNEWGKSGRA